MGMLQEGIWTEQWIEKKPTSGKFVRKQAHFRNWITADGSAGETGSAGFKAEPERYHLYVSHACPWAHRTMIFRSLKGLEKIISVSVVNWLMGDNGWTFEDGDGVIGDPINNSQFVYQIYTTALSDYSGRVTVPILWDKKTNTIVSNESSEIIRMFNSAFDGVGAAAGDCYPQAIRGEIDNVNARIYSTLNNGVYKCGFATSQEAYETAFNELFETLGWLEQRLSQSRYLVGKTITEADWRLFTTLLRFDPVYFGHFKCNLKRIADYANLSNYLRDLYQQPGIEPTVNFDHIKNHYYGSHETINPTRIVPLGPEIDNNAPHNRSSLL